MNALPSSIRTALSAALVLVLATGSALAQAPGGGPGGGGGPGPDASGGGFLDGLGSLFGGGEASAPGAYVSPSARDLVPDGAAVGVPKSEALRRLDPIALPETTFGGTIGPDSTAALPPLPALPAFAPPDAPGLDVLRPKPRLVLDARLSKDGEPVPDGLEWRLFSAVPALDGQLPLVAAAAGGEASFDIPRGDYVVHLAFGRAGLTKRIHFAGLSRRETLTLDAGGLSLHAVAADKAIVSPDLDFDIYTVDEDEGEGDLVASDVPADTVVRLNAGVYHIVSHYGPVNAVVRAVIQVDAGKITEATLKHQAARLSLKLVRAAGGEAMADTGWTITSTSGDTVGETVGAFASLILAAGDYEVVATNRDRVYQRLVTIEAGADQDVELTAADLVSAPAADGSNAADGGSGD